LDSDDAYLPPVLDWAASNEWGEDILFDFARGWTWDINADIIGHYGFRDNKQGHYLFVTNGSRDQMLNCGGNHIKARRQRDWNEIFHDRVNRSWLQVVHGGNVWAKWRGKQTLSRAEGDAILEKFGIDRKAAREAASGAGGGAGGKLWYA
jgi:hypothetical protein